MYAEHIVNNFFVLLDCYFIWKLFCKPTVNGIFVLFWLNRITGFCFEINELLRVSW